MIFNWCFNDSILLLLQTFFIWLPKRLFAWSRRILRDTLRSSLHLSEKFNTLGPFVFLKIHAENSANLPLRRIFHCTFRHKLAAQNHFVFLVSLHHIVYVRRITFRYYRLNSFTKCCTMFKLCWFNKQLSFHVWPPAICSHTYHASSTPLASADVIDECL